MINPNKLYKIFIKNNIEKFIGVPDSVLKNFLSIIPKNKNLISNNEGSAVAYGIGYYLSSKKIPLIYLQNSGLGNTINPIISIAHKKVYSIPLVMLIGWRGSPNAKDEPQHQAQGEVTKNFLNLLGVKFKVINSDKDFPKISKIIKYSKIQNVPVAILVKNGKINNLEKKVNISKNKNKIKRINFLEKLLTKVKKNTKIISTTGYTSRELYQLRVSKNFKNGRDFYMVGGMGHASNVALGISKYTKNQVIVLDGDGSFLMHLGALVNCGVLAKNNFKYILLNNSVHESVGSQKTLIDNIKLRELSNALGFKKYIKLNLVKDIDKKLNILLNSKEKIFFEVKIKEGSVKNLLRPKYFKNIKLNFI